MGFNYPIYERSCRVYNTLKSKIKRNLTFNGIILPTKGDNIASMCLVKTPQCYRKKRIMYYDEAAKKAFITERSLKKTVVYIIKVIMMLFEISFKLTKAQKAYREDGLKLRTLEFWKGYLEI